MIRLLLWCIAGYFVIPAIILCVWLASIGSFVLLDALRSNDAFAATVCVGTIWMLITIVNYMLSPAFPTATED